MSIQAVAWALDQHIPDARQKLILIALANHADPFGKCFPGLTLIAREASCDRRTVIRHLPELEAAGLISIERNTDGVRKLANTYRLAVQGSVTVTLPPSDTVTLGGDTDVTTPSDTVVTTKNHHSTITSPKPPSRLPGASTVGFGNGKAAGSCWVQPGTPAFAAWLARYESMNAQKALRYMRDCEARGEDARVPSERPEMVRA